MMMMMMTDMMNVKWQLTQTCNSILADQWSQHHPAPTRLRLLAIYRTGLGLWPMLVGYSLLFLWSDLYSVEVFISCHVHELRCVCPYPNFKTSNIHTIASCCYCYAIKRTFVHGLFVACWWLSLETSQGVHQCRGRLRRPTQRNNGCVAVVEDAIINWRCQDRGRPRWQLPAAITLTCWLGWIVYAVSCRDGNSRPPSRVPRTSGNGQTHGRTCSSPR